MKPKILFQNHWCTITMVPQPDCGGFAMPPRIDFSFTGAEAKGTVEAFATGYGLALELPNYGPLASVDLFHPATQEGHPYPMLMIEDPFGDEGLGHVLATEQGPALHLSGNALHRGENEDGEAVYIQECKED